jgi:prolyl-tRNA editing enzyme YbaK/EbsC (Cys-tRNA(Pro) deacylase)
VSGYPPGGTPSIHHKTPLEVIVDKSILTSETIYCGGGTRDRLLELRTEDIMKLNKATTADISEQ